MNFSSVCSNGLKKLFIFDWLWIDEDYISSTVSIKVSGFRKLPNFSETPIKKNKLLTADLHNGMAKQSVILKLHLHNEFLNLPNYIPQKEKNKS